MGLMPSEFPPIFFRRVSDTTRNVVAFARLVDALVSRARGLWMREGRRSNLRSARGICVTWKRDKLPVVRERSGLPRQDLSYRRDLDGLAGASDWILARLMHALHLIHGCACNFDPVFRPRASVFSRGNSRVGDGVPRLGVSNGATVGGGATPVGGVDDTAAYVCQGRCTVLVIVLVDLTAGGIRRSRGHLREKAAVLQTFDLRLEGRRARTAAGCAESKLGCFFPGKCDHAGSWTVEDCSRERDSEVGRRGPECGRIVPDAGRSSILLRASQVLPSRVSSITPVMALHLPLSFPPCSSPDLSVSSSSGHSTEGWQLFDPERTTG